MFSTIGLLSVMMSLFYWFLFNSLFLSLMYLCTFYLISRDLLRSTSCKAYRDRFLGKASLEGYLLMLSQDSFLWFFKYAKLNIWYAAGGRLSCLMSLSPFCWTTNEGHGGGLILVDGQTMV